MTISSSVTKVFYAGDDLSTVFSIPFYFIQDADIQVILKSSTGIETTQILSTNYTLTGSGNLSGGECTLGVILAIGETLGIFRNVLITQETDYVENDPFPSPSHETALDKLTMICQELDELLGRSVTLSVFTALSNLILPDPDNGKALIWNDEETNLINSGLKIADLSAGAGTAAELNVVGYSETLNTFDATTGGIVVLDIKTGTYFAGATAFAAQAFTFDFTNLFAAGRVNSLTLEFQNAVNASSISFPAGTEWEGGVQPSFTTNRDIITFLSTNGGSTWLGFAAGLNLQ